MAVVVRIRQSRISDQERVFDIWRNAVDSTHHFLTSDDRRDIEIEVREFLPQVSLWLAVDDSDGPMGFMLLAGGHMEALFVDPSRHGLGVGRALIQHALSISPTITTEVNEQNTRALSFYLHMGFECIGYSQRDQQGRAYPLVHMRLANLVAN